ncbi:hypothetical protein Acsp02_96680 [Actinoplanes sp. NBRC 103695]|nr:hypothetical protein Acsp02_96680 [Actinoplanes sp. NBRC 103695]
MNKLAGEVAAVESELADLATTRQTLTKILEHEVTAAEPAVISEPYQTDPRRVHPRPRRPARERRLPRAEDRHRAQGHRGIRAKLKRLVNRQILTETQPGLFTLIPERT